MVTVFNSGSEEPSGEIVLVTMLHLQQRSFSQDNATNVNNNIIKDNVFFIIYGCIKLQKTIMHTKKSLIILICISLNLNKTTIKFALIG